MGSVGNQNQNQNQNPWSPYNNYKDCTQSPICSINCPQFCYFFFPPPPSSDSDSTGPISPFIIAVIGVLAGAFLLVGYYTIVTRYCNRRSPTPPDQEVNTITHQELTRRRAGLDESLIRAIASREYKKGDGLIEGTECAVCLTDFREREMLRILPKCGHAFHLPCIDTWLRSQSSCPLCRAGVVVLARPVLQDQYVALNIDVPGESRREDSSDDGGGVNAVRRIGRSVSLGAFPARRQLLISDVGMGIGSSIIGLKRSVSSCEVGGNGLLLHSLV